MDLIIKLQDYLALAMVLVSVITLVNMFKEWKHLWDDNLTDNDRSLLMRIAAFVVMPIIVLFHEGGHALATICFGGRVQEFHYGFFIGNVVSSGDFTELQSLLITLAGNVVQILCGLVALVVALVSTSPPVVALSVYVVFWAIGGTLVAYTILSLFGMYGDWMAIYSSPLTKVVYTIAIIHIISVIALCWLAYTEKPRLWFARKTKPSMVEREKELLLQLEEKQSIENYLQLAWFYYEMGVEKEAEKYVNLIEKLSPTEPGHLLLKGYLLKSSNELAKAQTAFLQCAQNQYADDSLKCRANLEIGDCEVRRVMTEARGGPVDPKLWNRAIEAYTLACQAKTDECAPYFYRGKLYAKQNLYNLAEQDLAKVLQLQCSDTNLSELAKAELASLRLVQAPKQ
jgi:hypothetical protein